MRSFRVRPRAHSNYCFRVIVFPTLREMEKYERPIEGNGVTRYAALSVLYRPDEGKGWLLGDILFTERSITPELIAHESAHAAEWYARRIGRRDGETIAAATASITADILRKIEKSKEPV